jgi:hypothetical protein
MRSSRDPARVTFDLEGSVGRESQMSSGALTRLFRAGLTTRGPVQHLTGTPLLLITR